MTSPPEDVAAGGEPEFPAPPLLCAQHVRWLGGVSLLCVASALTVSGGREVPRAQGSDAAAADSSPGANTIEFEHRQPRPFSSDLVVVGNPRLDLEHSSAWTRSIATYP